MRAAERYRLMGLVDRWVVQTTLAALGRGGVRLAAGRSLAHQHLRPDAGGREFLEFVVECLDRTGCQSGRVCFEVTENSVVANIEHARRFIGVLHGMGCKFALDDFGKRPRLVREPEEPADGLPEDRRLVHPQSRRATTSTRRWSTR